MTAPTDAETPFAKSRTRDKRLKALFWGDSGAGKTTLALQFPRPVLIDLEGGADLYGEKCEFDVLRATSADEVMAAVRWLGEHPHEYRTLIIDPVTVYWDALQKKWSDIFLLRNKGTKANKFEFYDLQPRDWMTLKAEHKELIRRLIALDMNVIVTARQKTQYADGGFMRAVGETFDGEKSLPYVFDVVLRLFRDEKGRFLAECLKDRTGSLPTGSFETSISLFEEMFGKDTLTRPATFVARISDEQKLQIQKYIHELGLAPELVSQRLAAYGADSLDDLTGEDAQTILTKFEAAIAQRVKPPQTQPEA